jgi:hypothetical protein
MIPGIRLFGEEDESRVDLVFKVDFWVDERPRVSSTFLSNPAILEAIQSTQKMDVRLGSIAFLMKAGGQGAIMERYYPLGTVMKKSIDPFLHFFERKGIAQLMEYHALLVLLKKYPKLKYIQLAETMSVPHKRQMRMRRISDIELDIIPIKKYLTALLGKIARDSHVAFVRKNIPREPLQRAAFIAREKEVFKRIDVRRPKVRR